MFNNKSILITGGTGTLGRGLVATLLAKYNVKKIVIFSRDELKQSEMENDRSCIKRDSHMENKVVDFA